MRGFAPSLPYAALALFLPATLQASSSLNLPPNPQGPGGEDSIETAEGTRCRQSINSNGTYLDTGVVGRAASPLRGVAPGLIFLPDNRDKEVLAYARVTVPLGKRPQRIDCTRVYELEIARLRRELELLKLSAE